MSDSAARSETWVLRRDYDALLAENQQLREALAEAPCEHGYTGDERKSCACAPCMALAAVVEE